MITKILTFLKDFFTDPMSIHQPMFDKERLKAALCGEAREDAMAQQIFQQAADHIAQDLAAQDQAQSADAEKLLVWLSDHEGTIEFGKLPDSEELTMKLRVADKGARTIDTKDRFVRNFARNVAGMTELVQDLVERLIRKEDPPLPGEKDQEDAMAQQIFQQAADEAAEDLARIPRVKATNLPEDFDEINHLAALVDLHKVFGRSVIAVRASAYAALKEALDNAEDQGIVDLQSLPGDIHALVPPEFLGWAFNRPPATEWPKGPEEYDPCKPVLLDPRPASERTDRPATWNPLENEEDAADFQKLYGIAQDPRHTVRYVLSLKCPPKRPRKTWRAERIVRKAKDVEKAFDLPEGPAADGPLAIRREGGPARPHQAAGGEDRLPEPDSL